MIKIHNHDGDSENWTFDGSLSLFLALWCWILKIQNRKWHHLWIDKKKRVVCRAPFCWAELEVFTSSSRRTKYDIIRLSWGFQPAACGLPRVFRFGISFLKLVIFISISQFHQTLCSNKYFCIENTLLWLQLHVKYSNAATLKKVLRI